MTPAELAALIRGLAVDVFTENDLDPSVLPDDVVVERPRNPEHGDYATNVAMQAAGRAGAKPRDVAGWLVEKLAAADGIDEASVAGPGFINIRLGSAAQLSLIHISEPTRPY